MKHHSILLGLGIAASALLAHAMDQALTRRPPSALTGDSLPISFAPEVMSLTMAPDQAAFPTAWSALPNQGTQPEQLRPGSYLTTPFSCIVIVPETHLDEMAVRAPGQACLMPTLKPELKFIPLGRK
jgi:hypothetical protein